MKKLLALTLLVVSAVGAVAQMPAMEPPKELRKLDWSVGKWKGEGESTMQGMTIPFTGEIETTWHGQTMLTRMKIDYQMVLVEETMYLCRDEAKSEYVSYSFANVAATPRVERGKWEGDKLVMVSEPWAVMGQSMVTRATLWKVDDSTIRYRIEVKEGDEWSKMTEFDMKKG